MAQSNIPLSAVPAVLQEVVNKEGGWQKAWEQGITPWDLGGVHPLIADLVANEKLPSGRVLVPGCGSGYDALALASPARHVVCLDISELAISRAKELAKGQPAEPHVEFVEGDFFEFSPEQPFDFAYDYTFFCALQPALREKWAQKYSQLLAPQGELLTLMFPLGDHEGGPPFAVSLEAYEKVLAPLGFEAVAVEDSVGLRAGKEKVARWQRKAGAKI